MLILLTALAGMQATPAAPAPAANRMLKDIPGVTVKYYQVPGRNADAVQKSLKSMRPKGANGEPIAASYNWSTKADVTKRTEGATCTIVGAKVQFSGTAELPQLADPKALDAATLKSWNSYVEGLDHSTALALGFFADRIGQVERSLVGLPCDKAGGALNSGLAALKVEQEKFMVAEARKAKRK